MVGYGGICRIVVHRVRRMAQNAKIQIRFLKPVLGQSSHGNILLSLVVLAAGICAWRGKRSMGGL